MVVFLFLLVGLDLTLDRAMEPSQAWNQPVSLAFYDGIWVLDRGLLQVVKLDTRGRETLRFGGDAGANFVFSPQFTACLAVDANYVYIWDGSRQLLHAFSHKGTFKTSFAPDVGPHHIIELLVTKKGVVALIRDLQRTKQEVWLFNQDFSAHEVLLSRALAPSAGEVFHAFTPDLCLAQTGDEVWVGFGRNAKVFTLFDPHKALELTLPKIPVTELDREEFLAQSLGRGYADLNMSWPDHKPFFNQILWVDQQLVTVSQSPVFGNVEASLFSKTGTKLGDFQTFVDEGGRLFSSQGHLFVLKPDLNGSFSLYFGKISGL